MGHRHLDFFDPLHGFSATGEPLALSNERLRRRLRLGHGLSLHTPDQLDAIYDHLVEEPLLRLEYDRFLPEVRRPMAD